MKPYSSLADLQQGLRRKDFSAVELTEYFLDRIERLDGPLNSLISYTRETALRDAAAADKALANNKAGSLTGIPLVHKDLFTTKGVRTTCASKMLTNFYPPYDATVVKRLRSAGTTMLGKANMDEFAMGSSNETSAFGAVANPWDTTRSPGGSSGGSAAAVAAGLIPIATGTDTGGSIRQPASFCGVTGLKPTYGRVSRFGMIAFASSLDQGGPIARSADDCGQVLSAMEGPDPNDATSADRGPTGLTQSRDKLKFGFATQLLANLDPSIADHIENFRKTMAKLGHEFHEVELPHLDVAGPAYYVISGAEASANLARYDGVRYGHRTNKDCDLDEMYRYSRSEGFGAEVKRRLLTGTFALSVGYYDAYYLKAQQIRRLIWEDFLRAFEQVDLILSPTTPTTAFKTGSLSDEPVAMYKQDIYTIPVSLAGLPALSLPCGFAEGLPIGLQLIGRHFDEATILDAGRQFQRETDWHTSHPMTFEA